MNKLLTTGTLVSDVCRYMLLGRTFQLEQESDVKLIEERASQTEGHKGLVVGGNSPWFVHLVLEDKSQDKATVSPRPYAIDELELGKYYALSLPNKHWSERIVVRRFITSCNYDTETFDVVSGARFVLSPNMKFVEVSPTWALV